MSFGSDPVGPLREALRLSPDNVPLRRHLAATLLSLGRGDEAEAEYKQGLQRSPNDPALKLGLAEVFYHQSKNTQSLVVVEDLLKAPSPAAAVLILHARLLLRAGEVQRAVHQYRQAIDEDPAAADVGLASQLGIDADPKESEVVEGRVRQSWDDDGGDAEADAPLERPKIDFADVGGMDKLKEEIRLKIILPLAHPEMFKAYGKAVGGGILMYGPPGCGKTHLARATAGEVKANFLAVGINDVLDMWIGSSEHKLHELFEHARRNRPCVLFFDEVDALGASRTDMRQAAGRHLINQFLSELDGVQSSNEGVLILAATNAPWHLDTAFRRPGRFDRILFVPPPDAKARAEVLRILCTGKPTETIDHEHLAKKTEGFSGADLKAVLDIAIERKLREALASGTIKPLTTKDLAAAASEVRVSTKEWFATARNYALYSNEGGLYDDILKYLKI
ncbi:MAG: ATP-binding protein [Planctomycetia bacterium]|nr:ATP-binding protein [Planctomycetia bacterium]